MKKMRRLLCLLMAISMLASITLTVAAADYGGFLHQFALHVKVDFDGVGVLVAEDQLIQGVLALRDNDAGAVENDPLHIRGKVEFFQ